MNWIFFVLLLALVATTTLAAPTVTMDDSPTVTTDDFQDFQLGELFDENQLGELSDNNFLECGCCYSSYVFQDMVQCEDGHLFCTECVRRAAEAQMGLRRIGLKCMSRDGCAYTFERSQFMKALPPTVFEGWEKIKMQECTRLTAAKVPNLVMCPFCVYAAEIDPPNSSADVKWNNKEFRCYNEECGVVSCRICKEKSHLPLSCEEMKEAEDLKKVETFPGACQYIEQARSKALLRECPKCPGMLSYKEVGCNKMTCPECGTKTCYVCGKSIHGYRHFDRRVGYFFMQCPLFEAGGTSVPRNERDVHAAAKKAAAKLPRHMRDMVNERTPLLLAPPGRNVMQRITANVPQHNVHIHPDVYDPFFVACTIGCCVAGGLTGGVSGCGVLGSVTTACWWGVACCFNNIYVNARRG